MLVRLAGTGGVRSLIAESALLKHQLLIVNRPRHRAPNLRVTDRFIVAVCSLFIRPSRLVRSAIILKPSTILNFHRNLVKLKYRLLFCPKRRAKPGPKGPTQDLIHAVVEMKLRNPDWGCQDVVRRILAIHYHPSPDAGGGPSWLTFLGHMKDSLWSIDLFRCESLALRTYWVLVVMDQFTRRIIGFGIQRGIVDGLALCRMFNQAIQGHALPKYVSSDHDPLYRFHQWQANLRVLEVTEIKTVPYVPLSHPSWSDSSARSDESVSIRHFSGRRPIWRTSSSTSNITFNAHRTHVGLDGRTPELRIDAGRSAANLSRYTWQRHCRGLYQTPAAA
jgi:putative transposase